MSKHLGKNIRSHSFRISVVSDLLEHGVPIHQVKELIGDKNISSTMRYSRDAITKKGTRSIIAKVNSFRIRKKNKIIYEARTISRKKSSNFII